jgi:NlpC/P60 family putative phage cell wall peptidase
MATTDSPPPCGEVEAQSASGGGATVSSAQIVTCARDWIGTPYVHQASVKGVGCDCLGLLRGVWREIRGREPQAIPPYRPGWDQAGESLRDGLGRHLTAIDLAAILPGDVLLFRMVARGAARHCAILAIRDGALTLIHARQNKRVGEEPFTAFWRARLAYAFRL